MTFCNDENLVGPILKIPVFENVTSHFISDFEFPVTFRFQWIHSVCNPLRIFQSHFVGNHADSTMERVSECILSIVHWKFKVGDKKKISKYKNISEKRYLQNWSDEIFVDAKRHESSPSTYGLDDLLGEEMKRRFYEQELQKVINDDSGKFSTMKVDNDEYIVENVLETRRRNGKLEHFVKWQGYADKFNSWTTDVHRL